MAAHKLAELRVTRASSKLAADGTLTGTAVIENAGRARAHATIAGIAWKSSATHGSIQLGRFGVPALKPGQRHRDGWHVKLPSSAAAGSYDVTVCADVLSQVHEASKKHECRNAGTITFNPKGEVKGYKTKEEPKTTTTPTEPPKEAPKEAPKETPKETPPGPPDTTITSGPSGAVATATATFDFTPSQAASTFQCSLDGAAWAACSSPQTYTGLAQGAHVFQVRAINSLGEVDPTPAEAKWMVETEPPLVGLAAPLNEAFTNEAMPLFDGTASNGANDSTTVTLKIYSGLTVGGSLVQTLETKESAGSWATTPTKPLTEGTYTAQASQVDAADGVGVSNANTFTVKLTPPLVTLTEPPSASYTNKTKPTFAGDDDTAAGDLPMITVDVYSGATAAGTPVQTLTTTATGATWSVTSTTSLADGQYTAQATQSDSAGNTGKSSTSTFTVDTVAPKVTLTEPSNGSTTNHSKPTFGGGSGTEPGDSTSVTVDIYAGSSASGTPVQTITTTAASGAWSVPASSTLANGTYTAQAHQTDTAGNLGSSSASTFTVNAIVPAVTLISPTNGSATNTTTPTFAGAAGIATGDSPAVTVEIYAGSTISGVPVQTLATTQTGGHWSTTPLSALPDGTYTAQAIQSNSNGNTGTSTPSTFIIDTIAPAVSLTQPTPEAATNNDKPAFSGTAGTEPGDSKEITLKIYAGASASGTPVQSLTSTQAGGQWTVSPTAALPEGTYTAQATQVDEAGNVGMSATVTFTVDTTPPVTTIDSAPAGKIVTGPVEVKFSSNEPGSTFQCSLDGAPFSACTSPFKTGNLAAGPHTFTVRATDKAGNTDPHPPTATWDSVAQEIDLCGPILRNQTLSPEYASVYVLKCSVNVPPHVVVNIGPGTIIKGEASTALAVEGTLEAQGTASEPVTFTSIRDDSIGGDTNGDGNATLPVAGDWSGLQASSAGNGNPNPTLKLDHVTVNYATTAISATQATTSITNSTIEHAIGSGIYVSSPESIPTLKNNIITGAGGEAIAIYSASLDMGALTGNSGSGNGLNGVQLGSDTVTVSSSLPWSGDLVPVLYGGCGALTVAPKVTLTLGPGTIVKGRANCGDELLVQGTLEAKGTASEPVTFTSWRDDSVGGDTNGDGNATLPAAGDWGGIQASPAGNGNPAPTVKLDHLKVAYASSPLSINQTNASITNSTIEHATGTGIYVSSPEGIPTVKNNTVTSADGEAIVIYNASLDMGALTGNSGSGNGLNGVQLGADTVTVSSALPWSGNLVPVLYGGCGALTVAPKVTLTLGAGTIVKGRANCGDELLVQGTLEAKGTASEPVTFTSWRDDSIGGDTNGDGNATLPAAGDWGGIQASPAGNGNSAPTLKLDHVKISYADTAISAYQTNTSITNSTIEKVNGNGIYVTSPVGTPTVTGNTITSASAEAIVIYSASLDMGTLTGNSGSGNGLNGVQLGADTVTVSSSLPWSGNLVPVLYGGCGALTVAPKVTLTLGPGSIIKGRANCGDELLVQGTLEAKGTASEPVTFTSWRDDSIGGDTNGDGNATLPAAGDWGGIQASPAGNGNPAPTVKLDHLKVDYASSPLSISQTNTSITNSTIEHATGAGINVSSPEGIPTVANNTVRNVGGEAIVIYSASLDMGALTGNSGSGDGLNGVQLGADTVTVSSSLPWSGNLVPVLYGGCGALTVAPKVTLTLGAGTIIKGRANCGDELDVQGSLVATGTASSPVTFTSWQDDSVGGDTNGDGNATLPVAGDWGGIQASPAGNGNPNPTLNLDHVVINYASSPLSATQSTTSITNSIIEHATGPGIYVSSPEGIPTVKNNTVTSVAGEAIAIYSASLDMGALTGNSGSGNGLNGVQLGSDTVTVSSSLPWSGDLVPVLYGGCGALTVAPKVTLTLGAGTIIKGRANCGDELLVQGTLEAKGTASEPVTFTSWRDDSIGGDTNGDGNATLPAAGDWGGIQASPAGNGNPNPIVKLDHVKISYGDTAILANQAATSITNSTIEKVNGNGIYVTSPVGTPTVTGNTITNASAEAIVIYSASLDMGTLTGNSGSGNGLNGVQLGSDTVTVSSALPWTGNLVPVLYGGCGALTVPAGVKLTLGAGTIIKGRANCGDELAVQGTLEATGTTEHPVTLTSWRDDSIGGDTNGDGNATPPAAGDWGGIQASPAGNGNPNPTLKLNHTVIDYTSNYSVYATQATTTITNSAIEHATGSGIYVSSPEGTPTIENNTVNEVAGEAIVIYSASLNMNELTGNSGSGNGLNGVQLGADTVTVSSAVSHSGNLVPVLYGGCGALTVPTGVKLTLDAGVIIKGRANCGDELNVQGSLVATGTATEPVTLTSWRDDSVGGDTNGDGNATLPAAADWGGIRVEQDGTAELAHTTLEYASTALDVAEGSEAFIHGAILHSTTGVVGEGYVDATEVDWGSASGPAPIGTGTSIEGPGVQPAPWVGFVPPPKPAPTTPPSLSAQSCANVVFIGVRGSNEDGLEKLHEPYPTDTETQETDMGSKMRSVYQTVKHDVEPTQTIEPVAVEYRALGFGLAKLASLVDTEYFENLWEGAYSLAYTVMNQQARCGTATKFILAGFSSGAFAVHAGLDELANWHTLSGNPIAAVVLLADPAKPGVGSEHMIGSATSTAPGLYTKIFGSEPGLEVDAIPSPFASTTISLCNKGDFICAPGIISKYNHAEYDQEELEGLGNWAAEHLN